MTIMMHVFWPQYTLLEVHVALVDCGLWDSIKCRCFNVDPSTPRSASKDISKFLSFSCTPLHPSSNPQTHSHNMSQPAKHFKVADLSLAAFGRKEISISEVMPPKNEYSNPSRANYFLRSRCLVLCSPERSTRRTNLLRVPELLDVST
jgi:Na+-transporting NADH:ubiquinone oxidoreductase subunit NqrA